MPVVPTKSPRRPSGAFDKLAHYIVVVWRQQMVKHMDQGARRDLERAERGDLSGARKVEQAEKSDPDNTEAVEQEASDGPKPRGLAR
jgi:hypothetical protein